MKIKMFYPNNEGKIEFTKEELEKLINEVYNEGKADGRGETYQPIIAPIIPPPPVLYPPYTFTTTTTPAIIPTHKTDVWCSNNSTNSYQATNGEIYYTNDDSIGRIYLQSGTLSEFGVKGGTENVT